MEKSVENRKLKAVVDFMRAYRIDSYQKLRLLLFLQQNSHQQITLQTLASRLNLGNIALVEEVMQGLLQVGLVKQVDDHVELSDHPNIQRTLRGLIDLYQNPTVRSEILAHLKPGAPKKRYLRKAHP